MASIQPRGAKFQLRVVHKLLQKPFFWTFNTEQEARTYGTQLEAMLANGIVPADLAPREDGKQAQDNTLVTTVLKAYVKQGSLAPSEEGLLATMGVELDKLRVHQLNYAWVEKYVRDLKVRKLAPGTIRKRVGALARVMDWHHRSSTGRDQVNPLRLLPRGYSVYSARDEREAGEAVRDEHRDRRLLPAEFDRVVLALSGVKAEGKERALERDPELELMFHLLVDTGLRLKEAYSIRVEDVQSTSLRVRGSKGHRGAPKVRHVPLKAEIGDRLKIFVEGKGAGLLFSFWDGTPEGLRRATENLSSRLATLFRYAGVLDFTAHDLRHEAACRWFELRDGQGRWTLSDVEICRLMGWSSLNLALRYASIRGQDLASRVLESSPA